MFHPRSALAPAPSFEPGRDRIRFEINPQLDVAALADAYAADSRVRIAGLLSQGALELYDYLQGSSEWIHLISTADGVLELDPGDRKRMSATRWRAIEAAAQLRARDAFQYRYEALRVPERDEIEDEEEPLDQFAAFMANKPMLDLLSAITRSDVASFSDGQATAYGPGDFLTGHDDDVPGKRRLAAYVFGLTPGWRLEWGGLLLFHGPQERSVSGLPPRFNALDLFKVPQQHSVSMVMPAAPHRRYALTGWLRGGDNAS